MNSRENETQQKVKLSELSAGDLFALDECEGMDYETIVLCERYYTVLRHTDRLTMVLKPSGKKDYYHSNLEVFKVAKSSQEKSENNK